MTSTTTSNDNGKRGRDEAASAESAKRAKQPIAELACDQAEHDDPEFFCDECERGLCVNCVLHCASVREYYHTCDSMFCSGCAPRISQPGRNKCQSGAACKLFMVPLPPAIRAGSADLICSACITTCDGCNVGFCFDCRSGKMMMQPCGCTDHSCAKISCFKCTVECESEECPRVRANTCRESCGDFGCRAKKAAAERAAAQPATQNDD